MIVYTGGSFDGLHVGHLELLAECRKFAGHGGRVVVGLNPDDFIVRYKRRAPLFPYEQREEILRACRFVDLVVANVGGEDSRIAIDVARPDVLAIGDDWLDPGHDETRYLAQLGVTPDWLAERGLHVEYIARTRGTSTTAIRERLAVIA